MLPLPTLKLIEQESAIFDEEDSVIERALEVLFAQFPGNSDTSEVLAKAIVLNQLYGAGVTKSHIQPIAKHIAGSGIDALLDEASPKAVDCIISCRETKIYYSFATKYCSWHRPTVYPIWDSFVDESLWHYKARFPFSDYKRKQVGDYGKWVGIVEAFMNHFGLQSVGLKKLDKFLFRMGSRLIRTRVQGAVAGTQVGNTTSCD